MDWSINTVFHIHRPCNINIQILISTPLHCWETFFPETMVQRASQSINIHNHFKGHFPKPFSIDFLGCHLLLSLPSNTRLTCFRGHRNIHQQKIEPRSLFEKEMRCNGKHFLASTLLSIPVTSLWDLDDTRGNYYLSLEWFLQQDFTAGWIDWKVFGSIAIESRCNGE